VPHIVVPSCHWRLSLGLKVHGRVIVAAFPQQDIGSQVQAWLSKRLGIQNSSLPDLPRIYVHTAYIEGATYRRLYASADCVVLPTR
jgi:hypothetical protein